MSKQDAPATRPASAVVGFEGRLVRDGDPSPRGALPPGTRFTGPAIVEQLDTTVLIEPGQRVEVDAAGNLIIDGSRQ